MKPSTNDKKFLQAINMFMQVVFAFFDIFFSIYIYEMSNNLNFVFCYSIFRCFFTMVFEFFLIKILNEKNYLIIYRLGFVFALISIALIFTISTTRLYMVFVVQLVYALTIMCYYLPHEVSIMNKNTKNSISKFVGIQQVLTLIAGVLSPFLSGVVIDYVSYEVLFIFIMILSFICFLCSFKINKGVVNESKITVRKFIKESHKIKHIKLCYLSHALHKAPGCGVITMILPIMLFMKFNSNFSVGNYSAIATTLSGIVLIVITKFYKPKNIYITISTSVLVLTSSIILIWSSPVLFFVYYFLSTISTKVIAKYDAELVYVALSKTPVDEYKKEHHYIFCVYDHTAKIVSYVFALIIYNLCKTVLSLSIIIFSLTILQIFASWLMIKSEKSHNEYIKELETQSSTNENISTENLEISNSQV